MAYSHFAFVRFDLRFLLFCFFFADATRQPILSIANPLRQQLPFGPSHSEIHLENQHDLRGLQNRRGQQREGSRNEKLEPQHGNREGLAEHSDGDVLRQEPTTKATRGGIYLLKSHGMLSTRRIFSLY